MPSVYRGQTTGPTTQSSTAYQAIRECIANGEFGGGQVLSEAELVRQLGMSRTPVREALHRLEAEGWLMSGPGRGHIVIELDEREIGNVYRVRAALEGLAAREAAAVITHTDMGRLKDLMVAMERALAERDDVGLAKLNSQFHQAIAAASNNQYLEAMLMDIFDVFERFRPIALQQPGRRERAAQEHKQLIEAFEAGDADRAAALAETHVKHALATRLQSAEGTATEPS